MGTQMALPAPREIKVAIEQDLDGNPVTRCQARFKSGWRTVRTRWGDEKVTVDGLITHMCLMELHGGSRQAHRVTPKNMLTEEDMYIEYDDSIVFGEQSEGT
jgi:hypothetical protein